MPSDAATPGTAESITLRKASAFCTMRGPWSCLAWWQSSQAGNVLYLILWWQKKTSGFDAWDYAPHHALHKQCTFLSPFQSENILVFYILPPSRLLSLLSYTVRSKPSSTHRISFFFFFMDHWAKVIQNKKHIRTSIPSMLGSRECTKMTTLGNPLFFCLNMYDKTLFRSIDVLDFPAFLKMLYPMESHILRGNEAAFGHVSNMHETWAI